MKARVFVTLKPGVLDPQGKAIHHALEGLGFAGVQDVRAGKLIELEQQGAEEFFGEPSLEMADLLRVVDGFGVISILRLTDMQNRPKVFSSFMLQMLAELYATLPEVGDLVQLADVDPGGRGGGAGAGGRGGGGGVGRCHPHLLWPLAW